MKLFSKFLIVYIIVFSLYMIYFYFKNKSKKRKNNLTMEMNYLIRIYGIDINLIGLSKTEKHIALINSFIITLDLFIYFLHVNGQLRHHNLLKRLFSFCSL